MWTCLYWARLEWEKNISWLWECVSLLAALVTLVQVYPKGGHLLIRTLFLYDLCIYLFSQYLNLLIASSSAPGCRKRLIRRNPCSWELTVLGRRQIKTHDTVVLHTVIIVCKGPCFLCFRLDYLSFLIGYCPSCSMAIVHVLAFFLVINLLAVFLRSTWLDPPLSSLSQPDYICYMFSHDSLRALITEGNYIYL